MRVPTSGARRRTNGAPRPGGRAPAVLRRGPPWPILITVASFLDTAEAELAKERLELEGIAAFVIGAQTAGVMPFLTGPTGGVRLQVAPRDVERAREVLGD